MYPSSYDVCYEAKLTKPWVKGLGGILSMHGVKAA